MTRKHAGNLTRELVVALIGVVAVTGAQADTLHVPGEYDTIQAAIDATWPGDVVEVADGVYSGPGNIDLDYLGRDITVRSANGAENCTIDCQDQGRAVWFRTNETPAAVLEGFTITNGSAANGGAVLCESRSNPTIRNCVFVSNEATIGGAFQCIESSPSLAGCTFEDNLSLVGGWGGAMEIVYGSDPVVSDCVFRNNRSLAFSGAIYIETSASPHFVRCTFENNQSAGSGGAIWAYGCFPTFRDCVFIRNRSGNSGGALRLDEGSRVTAINCLFARNTAVNGGAIRNSNGEFDAINCTFVTNSAGSQAGAVFAHSVYWSLFPSVTVLANCVLWNNTAPTGGQISMRYGSQAVVLPSLTVSHSDVQDGPSGVFVQAGAELNGLEGNINLAPRFVRRGDDDYRLRANSPCIDAGDNEAVPAGITTDLGGQARFVDAPDTPDCPWAPACGDPPIVDMGAYEFQPLCDPCDMNCDGAIDALDIEPFLELLFGGGMPCDTCTGDVNGDGSIDALDIEPFLNCLFP